ncbi:hypothetical protein WMY93_007587 [Mugilogobius chulae]|uniref:Plac8 onzin related protein 2 n=1 Tax=Mugilogobius chulae TaxID=88201 RepID=A0AAW0PGH5_9GOBI
MDPKNAESSCLTILTNQSGRTSRRYGQCLCLPLLDMFGGAPPPIAMSMRVSMRHRYGIRGDMCDDCLYSFFCLPCSWCQMSREMKLRELPVVLMNTTTHQ